MTRTNRINLFLILAALIATFFSTGCTKHKHHVYSEVYREGQTGHYYTRVYNPVTDDFWFYMYVMNMNNTTVVNGTYVYPTSPRDIAPGVTGGTGSWTKVDPKEVPKDLDKTEVVVQEGANGEPTAIVLDETPAIQQDVITEDTTQSQIEAMENEGGMIYDSTPATPEEIQENSPEPESHSFDPTENEPSQSTPDTSSPSTDSGSSDSGGASGGGDN